MSNCCPTCEDDVHKCTCTEELSCGDCNYLGSDAGYDSVWCTCDHPSFKNDKIPCKSIGTFDYGDKETPSPKWCPLRLEG